jgi:phenylalanyl-tRNA synthetase alpha chain
MIDQLDALGEEAVQQARQSSSLEELDKLRVSFLGKKGKLSEILKGLGTLSLEDRPKVGAVSNRWKKEIEKAIEEQKERLEGLFLEKQIQEERIPISLPARRMKKGSLHPLNQTLERILAVFARLGFDVTIGPEVETEYLTFEAVNIPKDHPARDMQDTFFAGPGVVLRTHTTPVQMRTMMSQKPPVRILCPGAVYRCDNDATHLPMFHQVEGLWVDRNVTMADLKGTLEFFAQEIFGPHTAIRMRPSYFPFVEPGAEVDVSCAFCVRGSGKKKEDCRVCKNTGWLEILGAGMVHPHLFESAGYTAGEWTGFAFGLGIERIAMLLFGIPDLRLMYQGDMRFLSQF